MKGYIAAAQISAIHPFKENLVGTAVDHGDIHFPVHFLGLGLTPRSQFFCQVHRKDRRLIERPSGWAAHANEDCSSDRSKSVRNGLHRSLSRALRQFTTAKLPMGML